MMSKAMIFFVVVLYVFLLKNLIIKNNKRLSFRRST